MKRVPLHAVVVLAVLPGIPACSHADEEEAAAASPEYAVVQRRDMAVRSEAAGLIEPITVVDVMSKASGEVLRIHVETGDEVERGTLLVEVDPRDVKNAFNQAEADLVVAEAGLTTAMAQKTRVEELLNARVATEQEYESAALGEANARAQNVKAETNLMLARERLADVTIHAPISGTIISRGVEDSGDPDDSSTEAETTSIIISRTVEEGSIITSPSENASGGTVLMQIADLTEVQVRALVNETDLGRLEPGQVATVNVEAYRDRTFEGRVLKIEPQAVVDQDVTMFPVLVRLYNSEQLLKPGMNADVIFEVAHRTDVVAVPNAAIINPRDAVAAGAALEISEDAVSEALRASARLASGPVGSGSRRSELGGPRGDSGALEVRPAVVFVASATGVQARRIMVGLNDFDYSEVVSGLEPGERVVLM